MEINKGWNSQEDFLWGRFFTYDIPKFSDNEAIWSWNVKASINNSNWQNARALMWFGLKIFFVKSKWLFSSWLTDKRDAFNRHNILHNTCSKAISICLRPVFEDNIPSTQPFLVLLKSKYQFTAIIRENKFVKLFNTHEKNLF